MSAAAASLLLVGALSYTLVTRSEPQVIAILMDAAGEPVVMIEDFGNDTAKVTPLSDVSVAADQSLQLWRHAYVPRGRWRSGAARYRTLWRQSFFRRAKPAASGGYARSASAAGAFGGGRQTRGLWRHPPD